jgi:hypothetical protein
MINTFLGRASYTASSIGLGASAQGVTTTSRKGYYRGIEWVPGLFFWGGPWPLSRVSDVQLK